MANTGIRPDEANWLEYWDVEIVKDDATGETILEIEVRGKRGMGYCKSTTAAVGRSGGIALAAASFAVMMHRLNEIIRL